MIDQKLPYHAKNIEDCIETLESSREGLSMEKAEKRLEEVGENTLPEKGKTNPLLLFIKQFKDFLVAVLVVAAIIAYIAGHMVDVYVIIGVIIINALIGFIQEYKAEKAILSLKSLVKPKATVIRDSEKTTILSKHVVPGDIIILDAGKSIPADARIIKQKNLQTTESALTGESMPVEKSINPIDEEIGLADRKNMLYKGTHVGRGSCKAIVTATGTYTELGKIAESLQEAEKGVSNFRRKTNKLAKIMAIVAVSTASAVFLIGYFVRDFEFENILLVTIASMVSSIPEGLPAVLSIVLAIGANRMAKKNAIIRDFSATEMAGSLSVILTDKTGTLTSGILTVKKIFTSEGKEYDVEGQGYELEGDILARGKKANSSDPGLNKAGVIACYSNSADIEYSEEKEEPDFSGDPTELSLLIFSKKLGMKKYCEEDGGIKIIDDLPFNSKQKFRASIIQYNDTKETEIITFGAPEKIMSLSSQIFKDNDIRAFNDHERQNISEQNSKYGKQAMRVIACGFKKVPEDKNDINPKDVNDLTFAGLYGIEDPLRPEVKEAMSKSIHAGIRVIMVTGDHKNTAMAIAEESGILAQSNIKENYPKVLSEEDLNVDDDKFNEYVENVNVFARVSPGSKLKILKFIQNKEKMTGMTGDGVNDAPALKAADVGFAMGRRGTDVARDAAQIVLSDDNFASIVNAIEQGRIVFRNIRNTSFFLVTTNFASASTLIIAISLGYSIPLIATQILWINLVTDGIMDISLATEPGSSHIMNRKPLPKKEPVLNREIFPYLFIIVPVMVTMAILAFDRYDSESIEKARTATFLVVAMTQVFNAFNMRSLTKSAFKIGLFTNKWLNLAFIASFILQFFAIKVPFMQNLFHFEDLPWPDIITITAFSSIVFIFGEIYKYIRQKIKK